MFKIKLLNKEAKRIFTKEYESYYIYNKELAKYKHNKKLQVLVTEEF